MWVCGNGCGNRCELHILALMFSHVQWLTHNTQSRDESERRARDLAYQVSEAARSAATAAADIRALQSRLDAAEVGCCAMHLKFVLALCVVTLDLRF